MSLSIKDAISTILAAAAAGILYVQMQNLSTPLLSSNRLAALALLIIGAVTCAVGNQAPNQAFSKSNPTLMIISILAVLSLVAAAWALITGSQIMVVALAVIILVMWLVTTLRHSLTKQALKAN
jgi:hypothetical protein